MTLLQILIFQKGMEFYFHLDHCSQVKHFNMMSRAMEEANGVNLAHERRPQTQEK
jgi:hypothetical protein